MNEFINSKMDDMRKFINDICKPVDYKPVPKDILPEEIAKSTSDLVRYVALSTDKLSIYQPPTELTTTKLPKLLLILKKELESTTRNSMAFNEMARTFNCGIGVVVIGCKTTRFGHIEHQ